MNTLNLRAALFAAAPTMAGRSTTTTSPATAAASLGECVHDGNHCQTATDGQRQNH